MSVVQGFVCAEVYGDTLGTFETVRLIAGVEGCPFPLYTFLQVLVKNVVLPVISGTQTGFSLEPTPLLALDILYHQHEALVLVMQYIQC